MKTKTMNDIIDKKAFGYMMLSYDLEKAIPDLGKKTFKQMRCAIRNGWLQIKHNPKRQAMKGFQIRQWNGKSWGNWF
jgi:hypothetical protein|tara:strand:- start:58 stop:288 length:231 start_codon:yes stop_codon:yes gene_type:complete